MNVKFKSALEHIKKHSSDVLWMGVLGAGIIAGTFSRGYQIAELGIHENKQAVENVAVDIATHSADPALLRFHFKTINKFANEHPEKWTPVVDNLYAKLLLESDHSSTEPSQTLLCDVHTLREQLHHRDVQPSLLVCGQNTMTVSP